VKAAVSRLEFAPSADAIRVDIETGRLEFTTRLGTRFDPEAFRRAIRDAGYGVGAITVDGRPVNPPPARGSPQAPDGGRGP
jgi:hypothetical protein